MKNIILLFSIIILTSCGAIDKNVKYGKLDLQTKMSETVFLDPLTEGRNTIYIKTTNTSGQRDIDIHGQIAGSLISKGYNIVKDASKAHYVLNVNVLRLGSLKDGEDPFMPLQGGGISDSVAGTAMVGAGLGAVATNDRSGALAGALIGAGIGYLSDAMVKVVSYNVVTDVQILERNYNSPITKKVRTKSKKSETGYIEEEYTEESKWKKYNTRIITAAARTNLKFEEISAQLQQAISSSIAGIF